MARSGSVSRQTNETKIELTLDLDGEGRAEVSTGVPVLDHMLDLFARHGAFDLAVKADGDLEIDAHHTVEDIAICLGTALKKALGEKAGIARFGDCLLPMDEVLAAVALDLSGRSGLYYDVDMPIELIGTYDTSLTAEVLRAFVNNADCTLHVTLLKPGNAHHIVEAVFKGLARALKQAVALDSRIIGVPSTKGSL